MTPTESMNNTALGNAFRSHVLALLKTKYPDATTEVLASWKKADIVFTKMDFGRRMRFAVECKNYQRKLTTDDLRKICVDYQAAFDTQEIHTLIIVSKHDIEAASRKFVDDTPRIRFMTYNELEEWLIGLRGYIECLAKEFSQDDVHAYYIDGRFVGQTSPAFNVLKDWVYAEDGNGIAILGGYGLGKSSLAKKLASDQAQRYLADPENERMPILVRLGQVVHEMELGGLFGKLFTEQYIADGYSFKTLMHLNELGRLVVILDGFDEMKHAMTESDFRSNFREFNKLRTGNAKVLLLGRPSAFTSESADLLIKGLGRMGGQPYTDQDFPPWREMTLDFFTHDESREFLTRFLAHAMTSSGTELDLKEIAHRVDEVLVDVHDDILQRPVQTRIVGQLAATPAYNFKNINRFKLYNDFIERAIDRDQEKRARKLIPKTDRRMFLDELAWWAWTRGNTAQGVFQKDEVPQTIFDKLANGDAVDQKAKRSEYLVTSLTEHKDSNFLYFAHRSFQEFLVASYLAARRTDEQDLITTISNALTPEICSFLREVGDHTYLQYLYPHLHQRRRGFVSVDLLLLMRLNPSIVEALRNKYATQLTIFDSVIVGYIDASITAFPIPDHLGYLLNAVRSAPIHSAECALYCLLKHSENDKELLSRSLAAAWERVLSGVNPDGISRAGIVVEKQHFGEVGHVLRQLCVKVRNLQKRRLDWAHYGAIARLSESLQGLGLNLPSDPTRVSDEGNINIESAAMEAHMSEAAVKLFSKAYAIPGDNFHLVEKSERSRPSTASLEK